MHSLRYLIGSLTLVAAVLGAIWIVRVLDAADDQTGLPLQVEFRDARGLRAGADVRFRGVTVGTVRRVVVSADGDKAVAHLTLEATGAGHACVDSVFWIVTPRVHGLAGVSGLDTLVRDAYIAFHTPGGGSLLPADSLLAGSERPPAIAEPDALDDVAHGDLLMTLLVPENHGLRPGATVVFRGVPTGDVRSVTLAADGTHVEVQLRIARRFRQTVTDRTQFWVARPYVSGALFSGFTVTDVNALLSPYVSYYTEPGQGVMVQDGFRTAAQAVRPSLEVADVPAAALRQPEPSAAPDGDDLALVRITYAAVERDTFSADDPIHHEGTGVLWLDRAGRAVVVTARSLVDGGYTERDAFGGDADLGDEQIHVLLASGTVLRAGRVWVDGEGRDLAALMLEQPPPDLRGTPLARLRFEAPPAEPAAVRCVGADGAALAATAIAGSEQAGGAALFGDAVFGIVGRREPLRGDPAVVPLALLPDDLRPL
ncbi:MAG: MCE family protein [Planctomycetes bacterium]|nr:MCE family protein [Planctomycetota bacterium]